jgi:hypothetical protein
MTDNERMARIDEKLDRLINDFNEHALESVEVRVHVDLLKWLVYGAVSLGLTALCTAIVGIVIKAQP